MDFFAHQEAARRSTRRLVVLYVVAVLAIVACVDLAAAFVFSLGAKGERGDVAAYAFAALGALAVIGIGAAIRTHELRRGGPAVAELLGGRRIPLQPHDPKERMLRNLVEEMAIAAGTSAPAIYVLDDEPGLNAFAAGWTPDDAAIAVTRGCLATLDRDELQGVVAHEFSHVFHGDMRLNIRLMGTLAGIVFLATIGRALVRIGGRSGARSRKSNGGGFVVFGALLVAIGWIGVLFARLIQAAISRQREFLADASAVQYTRNPLGIGMALARIGDQSAHLDHPRTEEASHMLFADGVRRLVGGMFASHPPIAERIARVLPGFAASRRRDDSLQSGVAALAPQRPAADRVGRSGRDALVAAFGDMQSADVEAARTLLAALPLTLLQAAHEPASAKSLACALLLDDDAVRRAAQMAMLPPDPQLRHDAQSLRLTLRDADRAARLPLLTLALPALGELPHADRAPLRSALRALAAADGAVTPFEWALLRLAERALAPAAGDRVRRAPARFVPLAARADAAAAVLSVLARAAHGAGEETAVAAFARGRRQLGDLPAVSLLPAAGCSLAALGEAVDALADIAPACRRRLLAGCIEAVLHDGVLQAAEADLLRALAALWDCPLPLAVAAG